MTENKLMVNANTKEYIEEYLFIENGELNIGPAIKVLSASAKAVLTSVESLANEFRVNVVTVFKVIYLTEDGITSMEESVENNRSIIINNILAGTPAVLNSVVTDCEMSGTNIINLRATIAINGWYENKKSLELLSPEQENVFVRTQKYGVESAEVIPSATACYNFNNEARVPIKRLIDSCVRVNVNNVFSGEGTCQVEGELVLETVFVSENGLLMSQNFSNNFSAEIMAENVNSDMDISVEAFTESVKVTLSDSDNRAILSEICLRICPQYVVCSDIEGVVDAYSTEYCVNLEWQEIVLDKEFCLSTARDKISSNIKIEGGLSNVECIVNAHLEGNNIVRNGDGLYGEGILAGTVIYTDDNGEYMSFRAEIPYSCLVTKKTECPEDLMLKSDLNSVYARVRTSNEIEISAEAMFVITGKRSETLRLVGNIEMGELKENDDVAISLYIVKPAQTLWDVAKELNSTTEILIEQNPEMDLPLKAGDKVLLYKRI